MDEKMKQWIDEASYEQLLSKWHSAPIGDPFFLGETGRYYCQVMKQRRETDPMKHIRTIENIIGRNSTE